MRPLGLGDTTYDFRRAPDSLLVAGRHAILRTSGPAAAGKGAAAWADEPFTAPGAFSVIGGVISSLRDVVAWDRWLASAFDDPDRAEVHDEVLPARLRRIMQTVSRVSSGMAYDIPHAGHVLDSQTVSVRGDVAAVAARQMSPT